MVDPNLIDSITLRHIMLIRRTIGYRGSLVVGRTWHRFEPHMNYYYADSENVPFLNQLVEWGYMAIGESKAYYVTAKGRALFSDITGVEIKPWAGKVDTVNETTE